jgi:hypothetical protein
MSDREHRRRVRRRRSSRPRNEPDDLEEFLDDEPPRARDHTQWILWVAIALGILLLFVLLEWVGK